MTARAPGGLLIWMGVDRARKRQALETLRAAYHIDLLDQHACDPASVTAPQLLSLVRERPAASACRLIMVDDAQRLKTACAQGLAEGLPAAMENWLVLWVDGELEARHPLHALLARATVERFGGIGGEGGGGKSAGGFAVVDAIAQRDAAAALRAIQEQIAQGRDPLEVLGLVAWQLQRWLTIKEWLASGAPAGQIGASAGLQDWQLQRVQQQVKGRSVEELRRHLEVCWQVDADAKRGRTLPRVALEQLVVELTR